MNTRALGLFVLIMMMYASTLYAQEHHEFSEKQEAESDHHEVHSRHLISASLNHTIIFSAIKNGESKSAIHVPSFGLNYTYSFNSKWAIGLHNDIILEEFVIEGEPSGEEIIDVRNEGEEFIERETPIAMAVVVIYKPVPHLGLLAGAGREFSPKEDFNLIRLGVEVPFHLSNNWEIFGVLTYDINIDAYNSLNYGIGIGKMF